MISSGNEYLICPPFIRSKTSGTVCLTYEDCMVKWDYLKRQKAARDNENVLRNVQKRGQTVTPNFVRAMENAVKNAFNKKPATKVMVQSAGQPRPTSQPNRSLKRKKGSQEMFMCNQYNSEGGCRGTPTSFGCESPDGGQFKHGCSVIKPDGKRCNSKVHNKHTCPNK